MKAQETNYKFHAEPIKISTFSYTLLCDRLLVMKNLEKCHWKHLYKLK